MTNRMYSGDIVKAIRQLDDAIDLGGVNRETLSATRSALHRKLDTIYVDGVETPLDTYQD